MFIVQRQFYHQVSVCYRRGIFRHLVIRCVIIPLGETGNFQSPFQLTMHAPSAFNMHFRSWNLPKSGKIARFNH